MKLIIGIVKLLKLKEVLTLLSELGIADISITKVKGFGRLKGLKEHYHGTKYAVDLLKKYKLNLS